MSAGWTGCHPSSSRVSVLEAGASSVTKREPVTSCPASSRISVSA
jgi:hypothetical protein